VDIKIEMEEPLPQRDSWQSFVRDVKRLADIVNPAVAGPPANYEGLFQTGSELTQDDLSFLCMVLRIVLSKGIPPDQQQSRLTYKQNEFIFAIIGACSLWSMGHKLGVLSFHFASFISFFSLFLTLRWFLMSLSLLEDIKAVFNAVMDVLMKLKNNFCPELAQENADDEEIQGRLVGEEVGERDRG
jgi:hypothetical protein